MSILPLRKLRTKASLVSLILALFLGGGYFYQMEVAGNFHPITPGEAYRSGQLNGDKLADHIKKYHIKSILNLRGINAGKSWYDDEIRVSNQLNVKHYDLDLSAGREPKAEDAKRLVEIFLEAPRPILIHCKAGADRSGLASAMWKVIIDKSPKEEAEKQLSIVYGHMPIGETTAMDSFFLKWSAQ